MDATIIDEAMIARAFEIADEQMFIALESYGSRGDEHGTMFGLCSDGHEVETLSEAGQELQEAVEWLTARGYVELVSEGTGECVLVLHRPDDFEEAPF